MKLQDIIGKDVFLFKGKEYTDQDLQRLSTEELEEMKMQVSADIFKISVTIKSKQIEFASGGDGFKKEDYINLKRAMSFLQRILPYLTRMIKQRHKDERWLSDYFMDEAKLYLSPGEYETILSRARKERELLRGGI